MPRGRSMPELKVSADERETLERWARRPTTAQALAQRARMILACAEGRPNDHVARGERVTRQTVGRCVLASSASGWTGCSTSRGPAPRGRLPTSTWSGWCGGRWRRASLLLTTEALITDIPDAEKADPSMADGGEF